jgi:hypothetical protein
MLTTATTATSTTTTSGANAVITLLLIRPVLNMEVVQEQLVIRHSEDVRISVGIGVGVVVVLAAAEKYSFSAGSHPFPAKPSTVCVTQHTWMDCIEPEWVPPGHKGHNHTGLL